MAEARPIKSPLSISQIKKAPARFRSMPLSKESGPPSRNFVCLRRKFGSIPTLFVPYFSGQRGPMFAADNQEHRHHSGRKDHLFLLCALNFAQFSASLRILISNFSGSGLPHPDPEARH